MMTLRAVTAHMPGGHHAHIAIGSPAVIRAVSALDEFCLAERLSDQVAWRLRVALDEIVANVVAYGFGAGTASGIDVWLRRTDELVEIVIADDGPAFDPLGLEAPNLTLPVESRSPGGLGIALVKALMDEVTYERTTRNVLTIRKRLDPVPPDRHRT